MRNEITRTVRRMPRPVRWGLYALGGYAALKAALFVLAIVSFAIGIAIKGALLAGLVVAVILMLRRR